MGSLTEHRVKIVLVNELDWFAFALKDFPNRVVLTRFGDGGIPMDCQVLSVHHDPYRRVFAFLIHHPDFPKTQPGEHPPEVRGSWEVIELPPVIAYVRDASQ